MVYIWDKATGTRIPVASDFAANGVPIGSVISSFSGVTPRGYLPFTGNTYNKSDYPELYAMLPAILKTGENQFTLPDLTGRVIQGADASTIGSLIAAGLPNITGTYGIDSLASAYTSGNKGALRQGNRMGATTTRSGSTTGDYYQMVLDAAAGETDTDGNLKTDESTKVFGKSNTVQPAAFGLYYYVKAVHYIDVSKDAIDDTAATDSNVWSAAKTKAEIEKKTKTGSVIFSQKGAANREQSLDVTFLEGFSDSDYSINITSTFNGSGWARTSYTVTNKTNTGFTIQIYSFETTANYPSYDWIATHK